jgi:putative intracellular protease/amidase
MRWRTVRRVAATVVVGLAVPGAAGAVGIAGATGEIYTVAARRRPVPLTGGLDLIPDLTFEELDDRLASTPDVIVVPQVHGATGPSAAAIVQWLQHQRAQGDPLLVSVCVGAEVLASAGLLDGRPVTSHWLGLIGLRRNYPAVRWTESDHPMHHPFHLRGAGRFLVLARDGEVEPNLVWKDTVLVRSGQTVDILFGVSNPGLWMAHCHIAEHLQSGMMFSFNVARGEPGNRDTEGVGARS